MADSKISALPASTTPLAGTEVLPVVQSGATKQVSVANLTAGRAVSALSYNATSFSRVTAEGAAIGSTGQSLQAVRTTNDSVLFLGYRTTPDAWVIGASYTSTGAYKPILFATSDTARWQLETDGSITQKTAAKGINFTANTPLAGMTSQLLNWYEEGTYTPTVDSGFTSTGTVTVAGRYTRIGRVVTIRVVIDSTGSIYIGAGGVGVVTNALPYAQASGGRVSGTFNSIYSVSQGGLVQFSGSTAYLIPGVTAAMNSTNTQITFVCTYQV